MTPVSHTLADIDGVDEKGLFVLEKTGARAFSAEAKAIAKRFVTARQTGDSLPAFPGALPPDLASAYVRAGHDLRRARSHAGARRVLAQQAR